jgi:hypothetical protein
MSRALQIALVMQGGTGWMGGSEYIKNLAQAAAAAAREAATVLDFTLITGHPLDENMRAEIGLATVVQLPARPRGLVSRWLRSIFSTR